MLCYSDKPLEGCFLTLTALEVKDLEEARALVAATGGHLFTGQTTRLVADWQRAYALCPDSLKGGGAGGSRPTSSQVRQRLSSVAHMTYICSASIF